MVDGEHYPRCRSMVPGEPTAGGVLRSFAADVATTVDLEKHEVDSVLDLFRSSISREWECCDCDGWAGHDGYKDSFTETHGVGYVCHGIVDFCGWYIVRKVQVSDEYKQVCYAVMQKLTDYLIRNEFMTLDEQTRIRECLDYCESVEEDADIAATLRHLEESSKLNKSIEEDEESIPWSHISSESGCISVEKVTQEGWILKSPKKRLLLRLPPGIAKLGKEGMELSCVDLDDHIGTIALQ